MMSFTDIKAALKNERQSVRYFDRKFLATYINALDTIKRNAENGIDDGYWDGNIWTRHAWDEVRKTNFYLKNSGAYCTFLQIVAH